MNSNSFSVLRGLLFREMTAALLVASLMLQSATAVAPEWWTTRAVLAPGVAADDYAVANVGQLKTIAKKAALGMEDSLAGGAGDAINDLIGSWETPPAAGVSRDDYAALNVGQLKSVAQMFYDRLAEAYVRVEGDYPWNNTTEPDDYALANLGQLKSVFAFEIAFADSNQNGMPDLWEMQMLGNLNQSPTGDFDSDGLNNLAEWQARTRPDNEDSDGDGFSDKVETDHGFDPLSLGNNPDAYGFSPAVEFTSGGGSARAWRGQDWPYTPVTYYKGWDWDLEDQSGEDRQYHLPNPQTLPPLHDLSTPQTFPKAAAYWETFPRTGEYSWSGGPYDNYATQDLIAASHAYSEQGDTWEEAGSYTSFGALRLRSLYPRTQPTIKTVLLTREKYTVATNNGGSTQLESTDYEVITLELPAGATMGPPAVVSAPVVQGKMEMVKACTLSIDVVVPDVPANSEPQLTLAYNDDEGGSPYGEAASGGGQTSGSSGNGATPPQPDAEVLNTALKPASELRIARMEDSLKGEDTAQQVDQTPILNARRDIDCFRIRVTGRDFTYLQGNNNITASIRLYKEDDSPDGEAQEVKLKYFAGDAVWARGLYSPALLLVSNDTDRNDAIDPSGQHVPQQLIKASGPNRKLKVLQMSLPAPETLTSVEITPNKAPIPAARIMKTIHVSFYVLNNADSQGGDKTRTRIQQDVDAANRCLLQAGLQIAINGEAQPIEAPAQIAQRTNVRVTGASIHPDEASIASKITKPREVIAVVYVNQLFALDDNGNKGGFARYRNPTATSDNIIYLSAGGSSGAGAAALFTLAHEIGHLSTKRGHYGINASSEREYTDNISGMPLGGLTHSKRNHNLMNKDTNHTVLDFIYSNKRIHRYQQSLINGVLKIQF